MNKSDLEKIVDIRVLEAKVLLSQGKYAGAYYLAGYSVECALKACIAKQVKQYDFPNKELTYSSYSHNLESLIETAGLKQKLDARKSDKEFISNWGVVKDWKETSRYEFNIEEKTAKDLFYAITNTNSGILVWLKTFW